MPHKAQYTNWTPNQHATDFFAASPYAAHIYIIRWLTGDEWEMGLNGIYKKERFCVEIYNCSQPFKYKSHKNKTWWALLLYKSLAVAVITCFNFVHCLRSLSSLAVTLFITYIFCQCHAMLWLSSSLALTLFTVCTASDTPASWQEVQWFAFMF